ncbi:MAG: hypothetical protein ACT7A5_15890 [Ferrovibrionaceae bacterium]
MRKLGNWTVPELIEQSGVKDIGTFLEGLRRARIIKVSRKNQRGGCAVWELVDDRGVLAPPVDIDGRMRPPGDYERLWFAIKALGTFDLAAVVASAEVSEGLARSYLSKLVAAGYLDAVRVRRRPISYSLRSRMWTGRRPPEVHPEGVFDPNRNRMLGVQK